MQHQKGGWRVDGDPGRSAGKRPKKNSPEFLTGRFHRHFHPIEKDETSEANLQFVRFNILVFGIFEVFCIFHHTKNKVKVLRFSVFTG